jgi:acyl-CoA reductase-like NAD-dependent aldehyde dehydrogenase
MIVFTGSTATGRKVAVACAERAIPCEMELGGKDCAIVLEDANIERAAAGIAWAALHNGGQDCASVERVVVHARVAELFERALVQKMEEARPYVSGLITSAQREIVAAQLREAAARGASFPLGGPPEGDAQPVPTLVTGAGREAQVWRDETFGPVIVMEACGSDEDLIAAANDSRYGLGTSIWTQDIKRGERIAAQVRCGMVWINNHAVSGALPDLPWVGTGASGTGITSSPEALMHLTTPKMILVDTNSGVEPWWYPYSDKMLGLMRAVVDRQRHGGVRSTLKTLGALRARNKELR